MNRSVWKVKIFNKSSFNDIRIWKRSGIVHKRDIGKYFWIHNGYALISRYIEKGMVGHCFGEYSMTRRYTNKYQKIKQKLFNNKNKNNKKNNKKK